MRVERLGPIITPDTHPAAGTNINGPSLIAVPPWVDQPLGRYYLYFADHKGSSIRLAFADDVAGPYRLHPPGALQLPDSLFPTETPTGIVTTSEIQAAAIEAEGYAAHFTPHIASPDVVVDHENRTIWMAYHGLCADGSQLTRMAQSSDGLHFEAHEPLVAFPYLRVLPERLDDGWLAMSMPGIVYRSADLLTWDAGPMLFDADFRHCALLRRRRHAARVLDARRRRARAHPALDHRPHRRLDDLDSRARPRRCWRPRSHGRESTCRSRRPCVAR